MMKLRMSAVVVLGVLVLAGSGGGGVAAGATGARVSGHLTRTSFTVAQAGSVKLIYRFSKTSRRLSYVLRVQKGSRWQAVKSVRKTGRFSGSYTVTVKSLFAGKAVGVGSYRLTLSAETGTTLLRFKVIKAATGGPPAAVRPQTGTWVTTSLSGPVSGTSGGSGITITSMSFTVGADRTSVGGFGFGYTWSGTAGPPTYSCSGSGSSSMTSGQSSPITDGRFSSPNPTGAWSGRVSGFVDGTFDTATSAHGTAKANGFAGGGSGCAFPAGTSVQTGTFTWTATWQSGG